MHRKELMLRTGAFVLSASLAMSSPIAVFAEGNTGTAPTVSVSSGDTDDSESDGAMTATPSNAAPDKSVEEDNSDEVVPEESLPENETSDDFIPDEDVPEKEIVSGDSKQEEKEVIDGDVKQKFSITVLDHFADSVETRETVTLEEGSEYSYSALESREGWQVVGDSSYDGVLTEDLTLDFYYEAVDTILLADVKEYKLNDTVTCYQYADGTLELQGTGDALGYTGSLDTIKNKSSIKEVIVGDGITGLGYHIFANCSNLERVILSDTCTSIDKDAFARCYSLETVIANNIQNIGDNAFMACTALTSIDLSHCTSIGVSAFYCGMDSSQAPLSVVDLSSLTEVSNGAFANKQIDSLVGVSNITKIGSSAFTRSHLSGGLTFDSLEEVCEDGLSFNDFVHLDLPSCKVLGYRAISDSSQLSTIYLPEIEEIAAQGIGSSVELSIYIGDKLRKVPENAVKGRWAFTLENNKVVHVFDEGNYFLSDKYIDPSTGLYRDVCYLAYYDVIGYYSSQFSMTSAENGTDLSSYCGRKELIPLSKLRASNDIVSEFVKFLLKDAVGVSYAARLNFDIPTYTNSMSYFESVDKMLFVEDKKERICLCHFPIAEWNGFFRGSWHIYGHIHNKKGET